MSKDEKSVPASILTLRQGRLLRAKKEQFSIKPQQKCRIEIILMGAQGYSNYYISKSLAIGINRVKRWRLRWNENVIKLFKFEKGESNQGVTDGKLMNYMMAILSDLPRSGAPPKITVSQKQQIVALACEAPSEYGIPISTWDRKTITRVIISKKIVEKISPRYVSKILKTHHIRPHKSEYWLFPKIENWEAFSTRVGLICELIINSISGKYKNRHVVSVDEKSGIQAIYRKTFPTRKKLIKRVEFEYTRNGTTTLMAAQDVSNGILINNHMGPTRKAPDFLNFIKETVDVLPENDEIIFIADQLNTHKSTLLVEWIAQKIGYEGPLGKERKEGILENMKTRMAFLEDQSHRIRFIYSPKHCSWINPIENWFGKLQNQVISGGVFSSVEELETNICDYIKYYNNCLSKPLKWKFKGFTKDKPLAA